MDSHGSQTAGTDMISFQYCKFYREIIYIYIYIYIYTYIYIIVTKATISQIGIERNKII